MTEWDDHELLAEYTRTGSEAAFATLVARYVNLVHSAAWRFTRNPHHAEEITQAVFVILARKAGGLRRGMVLSGWLYQTARLTAANFVKGEIRRQRREQEACMQSTLTDPEPAAWTQIAPLLDEAMGRLGETDRNAIVLRFFENKTARQVAVALNLNESAAHKRVNRALDKLHRYFFKRSVTLTVAAIAGAVTANSVQAAPVALAKSVTAIAMTKGVAASSSTLTLMKGALKIMAWTKAKTAVVVGVTMLLAATTATVVVEKVSHPKLSATDISWADDPRYWKTDSRVLEKIPPVFILRPMRAANQGGSVQVNDRFMSKGVTVKGLLATAYACFESRMILPEDVPSDRFDLMLTVSNHPREMLQNEIEKRFGLVAHRETRVEDVLVLKISNPNAPGIKASKNLTAWDSAWMGSGHGATIKNMPFVGFASFIENQLSLPILNQTGLDKRYDIQIDWRARAGESDQDAFKRALLEQLGLELVSGHEPIEMLVVEKVK